MTEVVAPRMGEVWDVEFDPVTGHEQAGRRSALVISTDAFNEIPHGLCFVTPLTTVDRSVPSHLPIDPPMGGLRQRSFAMCEQAKSISVQHCRKRRGTVDQEVVREVRAMMGQFLALQPVDAES